MLEKGGGMELGDDPEPGEPGADASTSTIPMPVLKTVIPRPEREELSMWREEFIR